MKLLKQLIFALAIFAVPLSAEAQTPDQETPLIESQVDKIPTYKGQHISSFKMWLLTNFTKYQEVLPDEFTLNLIIERDGGVYHVDSAEESKKLAAAVKQTFMKPPQFEPAVKDGKAVRYAISFTITKKAASNGYTGLSVYNAESYIHHIGEITTLPRLSDNRPFAELLDLMLGGGATKGITPTSKNLKFNLVCYKDGSHKVAVVKSKPTSSIIKQIEKNLNRTSPITPATSGTKSVTYVAPIELTAERLIQHSTLSFAQETKQRVAKGDIFTALEVEYLPSYHNGTLLAYTTAIKEQVYATNPKLTKTSGDVTLELEIDADGKLSTSRVTSSTNKKLEKAVASEAAKLDSKWSAAKIYGQSVRCRVEVKISFAKE